MGDPQSSDDGTSIQCCKEKLIQQSSAENERTTCLPLLSLLPSGTQQVLQSSAKANPGVKNLQEIIIPAGTLQGLNKSEDSSGGGLNRDNVRLLILTPSQLNNIRLINKNDGKPFTLPIAHALKLPSTSSSKISATVSAKMDSQEQLPTMNADVLTENLQCCTSDSSDKPTYVGKTYSRCKVQSTISCAAKEIKSRSEEESITNQNRLAKKDAAQDIHPLMLYNWKLTLNERKCIKCMKVTCDYISLNVEDMKQHHKTCSGLLDLGARFLCHHCNGRLSSSSDLEQHISLSHSSENPGDERCQKWFEKRQTMIEAFQREREKQKDTGIKFNSPDSALSDKLKKRTCSEINVKSWEQDLSQLGYAKCPLQSCFFLTFTVEEMRVHYSICNGDSDFAAHVCPHCNGCLSTAKDLDFHQILSHGEDYMLEEKSPRSSRTEKLSSLSCKDITSGSTVCSGTASCESSASLLQVYQQLQDLNKIPVSERHENQKDFLEGMFKLFQVVKETGLLVPQSTFSEGEKRASDSWESQLCGLPEAILEDLGKKLPDGGKDLKEFMRKLDLLVQEKNAANNSGLDGNNEEENLSYTEAAALSPASHKITHKNGRGSLQEKFQKKTGCDVYTKIPGNRDEQNVATGITGMPCTSEKTAPTLPTEVMPMYESSTLMEEDIYSNTVNFEHCSCPPVSDLKNATPSSNTRKRGRKGVKDKEEVSSVRSELKDRQENVESKSVQRKRKMRLNNISENQEVGSEKDNLNEIRIEIEVSALDKLEAMELVRDKLDDESLHHLYYHDRNAYERKVANVDDNVIDESSAIPEGQVAQPKKRGRKRKQQQQPVLEEQHTKEDKMEDKPGLRRSNRSRKSTTDVTEYEYEKEQEGSYSQIVTKKPRKSQNKKEDEIEAATSEKLVQDETNATTSQKLVKDGDSEFKIQKRPRGRPRKYPISSVHIDTAVCTDTAVGINNSVPTDTSVDKVKETPDVTCAKCKEKMMSSAFSQHSMKCHNNMAWIEGEPEIPENNRRKIMLSCLASGHKLLCELCEKTFKSYLGWEYHVNVCGKPKTERVVQCEFCGKYISKQYYATHQQTTCSHYKAKMRESLSHVIDDIFETGERGKRAAATKALTKIQEFVDTDSSVDKMNDKMDEEFKLQEEKDMKSYFLKPHKMNGPNNALLGSWKKEIKECGQGSCRSPECNFVSDDLKKLRSHFLECEKKVVKNFRCKLCPFICLSEEEIMDHINTTHQNVLSKSDSESDGGREEQKDFDSGKSSSGKKQIGLSRFPFLMNNRHFSGTWIREPFLSAMKWTCQFQVENFSKSLYPLLQTKRADWKRLGKNEISSQLCLVSTSPPFKVKEVEGVNNKTQPDCKRLNLFEGEILNGVPTFFTGGPVWSSAWCPIPVNCPEESDPHQFLALSCPQDMDKVYSITSEYKEKSLIQLWDIGPLTLTKATLNPKLALGILVESGPVWWLEWCPSGCYNLDLENSDEKEHLPRLGLLAAACADGKIRIYTICLPSSLTDDPRDENDPKWPVFSREPDIILEILADEKCSSTLLTNYQCNRVSWFQGKGHKIIAGGFSNGIVAIWDIENKSPLLKAQQGKITIYYPFCSFQAHYSAITALNLWPSLGSRYLMTASLDRNLKGWDLEDTCQPLFCSRRSTITAANWPMHWLAMFTSFDDTFLLGHSNTVITPVCGFASKITTIFPQNSVAWGLSYSDWLNTVAHSSAAGELLICVPGQLLNCVDSTKNLSRKKMMISYAELENLDGTNDPTWPKITKKESANDKKKKNVHDFNIYPRTYKETTDKYCLVINDFPLNNKVKVEWEMYNRVRSSDQMAVLPVGMYPLTSINCVNWNPNFKTHLWIASGYQCGLVRLLCMKHIYGHQSVNVTKEVSKILTEKFTSS